MEKTRERGKPYSLWNRRLDSGRFVYYVRFRLDTGGWSSAKSSGQSNKRAAIAWASQRLRAGILPEAEQSEGCQLFSNSSFTQDEVNKIFAQEWDDCRCLAANLIAATTGLFLFEIMALKRHDVHDDHLSFIAGDGVEKSEGARLNRARSFFFPSRTGAAIRRCLTISPYTDAEDFLLWSDDRSRPFDGKTIMKSLESMFDKIGVPSDERRERRLSFQSWHGYYKSVRLLWRRTEDRYRVMVEKAAEAICQLDAHGRIVFANNYAARILGYKNPDELLGIHALHLLTEANRVKGRTMEKRRRAGFSDRYETAMNRKDGSILYAKITAVPLEEGGRFKGTLMMASDINDEKEALMQRLKRSEQRITDLADKFPIAVCAVGRDSLVKYLNSPGESLFRFASAGDHKQIILRERVPSDVRMRYDRALFAVLERGETRSLVMDILVDTGERMPALWRFSPIHEDERILGSYVAIIDIGGELIETNRLPSDTLYNRFVLTERERDIADLLLSGLQYKEIASRFSIALPTARTHIMNLYRKMDIHSRDALARLAKRWQPLQTDEE